MSSIIKHERVRFEQEPAGSSARNPAARCAKGVRLLRVEGRVHAVELACSCGEVTVIELDYPERQEHA